MVFGTGTVIVAFLIPAKNKALASSSDMIAFEPIVPFVAPPATSAAAVREVAELEQLLERPSAAKPEPSTPRVPRTSKPHNAAAPALVDAELERPSIYQLALELGELPVVPTPPDVEPTEPLQTFYQRASRQHATCTELNERSSPIWAMPL